MMLGKAYLRLKEKEKAKEWLDKTLEYPGKRLDDDQVRIQKRTATCVCVCVCVCVCQISFVYVLMYKSYLLFGRSVFINLKGSFGVVSDLFNFFFFILRLKIC